VLKGTKHSLDSLCKMKQAHSHISAETRKRMSIAFTGRKISEQHKEKLSIAARKNGNGYVLGKWNIENKYDFGYWRGKKKPQYTGENANYWKGGKNKCLTCGKILSNRVGKRCQACNGIHERGENNPCWKGGVSNNKEHVKKQRKIYKIKSRGYGFCELKTIQMVYEDNIKKYGTLTCVLCKSDIAFGQDSLEHLTPLSRGGTNEYNNLAISHRLCNSKKSIRTYEEYMNISQEAQNVPA
jgi:5-methylcytosine-specific restriction endonuclease McrA